MPSQGQVRGPVVRIWSSSFGLSPGSWFCSDFLTVLRLDHAHLSPVGQGSLPRNNSWSFFLGILSKGTPEETPLNTFTISFLPLSCKQAHRRRVTQLRLSSGLSSGQHGFSQLCSSRSFYIPTSTPSRAVRKGSGITTPIYR